MEKIKSIKKPSLFVSLLPFIALIAFMLPCVILFDIAPQIPLVAATILTALIGIGLGHKWEDLEKAMIDSNAMVMQANFIILIIGMLVGVWIAGGIVPGLIYYGLNLFSPNSFLPLLPIICAVISVSTGSAWTTAGTMGVAAMGIGSALGIPAAIVAGAVVTGSSFGDKLSPLSDSTNLAAAVTGTDLFDHVRHMLYTTIPSFIISIIIYAIIGSRYTGSAINVGELDLLTSTLYSNFKISPLIFIAPISVIMMIVIKAPAVPGMIGGTMVGIAFAFYQGNSIKDVLSSLMNGFQSNTGVEVVDQLLNRGGMASMLEVISLVIIALAFGGIVREVGAIDTILAAILKKVRKRGSIMFSNIIACIALNFMAADQYMAIVIPGQMYGPVYKKLNLHSKNLSRVLEDAGTLTSGLVPWSTCGAVYLATLGVSAFHYAPFHLLGFINPIISTIYAFTGFSLEPLNKDEKIKDYLTDEDIKSIETNA